MRTKRLLIVDDEENIRFALKRWFEWCGYDVDLADDGDTAIEKCQQEQFDLVTLDLQMPRLHGKIALKTIKEQQPQTKIIVLTGFSEELDDPIVQNADKVMLKPISLTRLEEEIRKLLGHS